MAKKRTRCAGYSRLQQRLEKQAGLADRRGLKSYSQQIFEDARRVQLVRLANVGLPRHGGTSPRFDPLFRTRERARRTLERINAEASE